MADSLDVLVVAPHPDDAELGMGGAILKWVDAGIRVGILDLTDGEPTPYGSPEIRAAETTAATEVLGVTWLPSRDVFSFRYNPKLAERPIETPLETVQRHLGEDKCICAPLTSISRALYM